MSKAKISHTVKLREAVMRMKALGIPNGVIQNYAKGEAIPVCLHGQNHIFYATRGVVYEPKEGERLVIEGVEKFEQEHSALVYFVICTPTSFGNLESYLFVSDYEEEWEMDNADLKDGYAMTWTENTTHPNCSEFGSISFRKTACGGLERLS